MFSTRSPRPAMTTVPMLCPARRWSASWSQICSGSAAIARICSLVPPKSALPHCQSESATTNVSSPVLRFDLAGFCLRASM